MNKELSDLIDACMDAPGRASHPKFYAALDAKFEELKWRRGVHAVTGEVDRLKAELAVSSERVFALETEAQENLEAAGNYAAENGRLREALEKIANDKWAMGTDMKGYDCSIAEVARGALSRQLNAASASDADRGSTGRCSDGTRPEPVGSGSSCKPHAASSESESSE